MQRMVEIKFQSTFLREERHYSNQTHQMDFRNFNPRSYERNDAIVSDLSTRLGNFNPRSYERNDAVGLSNSVGQYYFNPRSYERND